MSSRFGSEQGAEMDEHPERELDELRALLRRVELGELEASDVPRVRALLEKYIDEAEAAGEEFIELMLRDPEA
jgi:hypothetical protein